MLAQLPAPPDALTLRKLVLVKHLYNLAAIESAQPAVAARRVISLVTFDLANETALKVMVGSLDPTKTPKEDFPGLVQQSELLLAPRGIAALPDRANLLHVHSLRNDAQHKAKYPSPEDVADCRTYTRDFLTRLLAAVWDRCMDSISLIDLLRDAKTKEFMERAERALAKAEFDTATGYAAASLHYAMEIARSVLFPRSRRRFYEGFGPVEWRVDHGPSRPNIDSALRFLERAIEDQSRQLFGRIEDIRGRVNALTEEAKMEFDALEDLVLLPLLGISHADVLRFRRIAGDIRSMNPSEATFERRGNKKDIDRSEAEFVLAFATEAILLIQGRIAAPEEGGTAQ